MKTRFDLKPFGFPVVFLFVLSFVLLSIQPVSAEEEQEEPPAAKAKAKKESPHKGQSRELEGDWFTTKEDHPVKLSATYYYGNADRETVPVLLLHDVNGSRRDFMPLIDLLVNNGYAVLAPDLRGHGRSTKRYEITPPKIEMKTVTKHRSGSGNNNRKPKVYTEPTITAPASRKLVDYLAEDFQPADFALMLRADLPALRKTLEKVHNEGLINMNRLVIIGVGRSASLALYMAGQDWKDKESGRFTKTLILIAPTDINPSFDSSRFVAGNRMLRENISVMAAIPQNDMAAQAAADRVRAVLIDKEEEEDAEAINLRFPVYTYPTEKTVKSDKGESQGTMTLSETFSSAKANLGRTVFNFIDKRSKGFKEKEARWSRLK